jgi:uncharacterized Zn ribbon protein
MSSLSNGTCPECGTRYAWEDDDKPPCPTCGWEEDPQEAAEIDARIARLTEEMLADGED